MISKKQRLKNKEFKIYSQNGEDGIISYIFSKIKPKDYTFVEIGAGDGHECNTATLKKLYDWQGRQIDTEFFATAENVNQLFKYQGNEIDLLSIDIDGNDYWIWKAIKCKPRVVVIEYNASFGHRSITIPYDPNFKWTPASDISFYHGASLKALTKLGEEKGYVLVGCESSGVNSFFVLKKYAKWFDKFTPEEAFYPHRRRTEKLTQEEQFDKIKHLEFVEI